MKKFTLKENIFLYSVIFILFFIKTKLTGSFGRSSYGSISFKETIEKIPEILVFSAVLLILGNIMARKTTKSEEKAIEAARKRIEEREKKEQLEHEERKDTVERQNNDQIKENWSKKQEIDLVVKQIDIVEIEIISIEKETVTVEEEIDFGEKENNDCRNGNNEQINLNNGLAANTG